MLSLLPYTSGPRAQGWHAPGHNHPGSAPAPQPPSLPPVCCLSHSNHSIVHLRHVLERPFLQAESLFPARRAELRQAWILCLWHATSPFGQLPAEASPLSFFPWPSHGSHTTGPVACWTDPSQIQLDTGVSPCPLLGRLRGGTGLRSGGEKVCLPLPTPPHTHKHTRVGTNYASHRGGAKPSGKHTTICLSAPDLLTGSRPRGPTRQRTQNLGGQRFRSHFPTHTGTCTACPRTQGAAETAALKQPGLASAPPSRSVGFRGNRA